MKSVHKYLLLSILMVLIQGLKAQTSDAIKPSAQAHINQLKADGLYRNPPPDKAPLNPSTPVKRYDIASVHDMNSTSEGNFKREDVAPVITTGGGPSGDKEPKEPKHPAPEN